MRLSVLVFLSIMFIVQSTSADMIVFKDRTKAAVFGRVVSRSDSSVTFDAVQDLPKQVPQRIQFPTAQIEMVVQNFDEPRLAALSPTDLLPYQHYALELAAQKIDPTARDLAIRLHMIVVAAAKNDLQSVKLASLRQLVDLARNEKERSEFETLLKLEGVIAKDDVQAKEQLEVATNNRADDETVLKIVRLIRRGQQADAIIMLQDPAAAKRFDTWAKILSFKEVTRIAGLNQPTRRDLKKLLTVELAISRGDSPAEFSKAMAGSQQGEDWHVLASQKPAVVVSLPNLSEINSFDPTRNIYRDGQWLPFGK